MKTLNSYLTRSMLSTLGMSLGILTFVMLSGHFFKVFDLLARGVPPMTLLRFVGCLLPDMLRFTLPLSLLITTVLVFSRLSADNEIVAMKAIGISLWQIISPALFLSVVFSALGLWLSLFISPDCRFYAEKLRWRALAETPLALLEPGSFTQLFPQCAIRIGGRNGDEMTDIHILMHDKAGNDVQDVVAQSGRIVINSDVEALALALNNASVSNYKLNERPTPDNTRFMSATSIEFPLNYTSSKSSKRLTRKPKYMNLKMLCARIVLNRQSGVSDSSLLVDLHTRLALALSPLSFLLLGLPFGIRSKRSELSIGLLICVLLALGFYGFMLLADALKDLRGIHPQYIIWIPNLLYQAIGLVMLKKLERRG